MNYRLKEATDIDREWLEGLRRLAYTDLFEKTWGGWDEERHQRHFTSSWEEGGIFIIETDLAEAGMIQLGDFPDHIEIKEIQILPQYQCEGLGSNVLRAMIRRAQESHRDIRLSLGLQNDGAHRLYKRMGFMELERTATHIHMQLGVK